jgi:hypothetical protein
MKIILLLFVWLFVFSCGQNSKSDETRKNREFEKIETKLENSTIAEFQRAKLLNDWKKIKNEPSNKPNSTIIEIKLSNAKAIIFKDDFDEETSNGAEYQIIADYPSLNRIVVGAGFVCGGESYIIDTKQNKIDTCNLDPMILPLFERSIIATATHDDNAGSEIVFWDLNHKKGKLKSIFLDDKLGQIQDIAWLDEKTFVFSHKSYDSKVIEFKKLVIKYL